MEYPFGGKPSVFTPFFRRFTDERDRDLQETRALCDEVRAAFRASRWEEDATFIAFCDRITEAILEEAGEAPESDAFASSILDCQWDLLAKHTVLGGTVKEIDFSKPLPVEDLVELREFLRIQQHFLAHEDRVLDEIENTLVRIFAALIRRTCVPGEEDGAFTVPLHTYINDLPDTIDRLMGTITEPAILRTGMFKHIHEQLHRNLYLASGFPLDQIPRKAFLYAADSTLPSQELIDTYLRDTPFHALFLTPVPFALPKETRFSHHWIISPPGTGKSTTLQYLIGRDLDAVAKGEASIVVMESNRDLIKAIEGLDRFGPGGDLEGKLVSIDVEDVEYPVALNLFDMGLADIEDLSPRDKEALLNSATSMLDYTFRALLGAELTSRQSTLFNFTIQLLMKIPQATLDTLIDLMQPRGIKAYEEHLNELDYDAQRFFQLKFDSDEFRQTKSQVVDRIFAIKRIRALSRIFSSEKTKLDLYTELGSSKVILINAAKSLLQEDGVEIFTRFFLAMILLSAEKRQLQHRSERMPTFVYMDECQDIIRRDEKIAVLLDQARKLNVGLILAHQRLDQLQPPVLQALFGSTAIKFAAQVSDSNAAALARNMETTPDFIRQQPNFSYAAYVRGSTATAISIQTPHVDLNRLPRMDAEAMRSVRDAMRERYAVPYREVERQLKAPEIEERQDVPPPRRSWSPKNPKARVHDDSDDGPSRKW